MSKTSDPGTGSAPRDDMDDMREEYDFTGAVRGKYTTRYRQWAGTHDRPPIDPVRLYEVQARLGYALWHSQALERALVAYLALVLGLPPKAAGREAAAILEQAASATLSHLRTELGQRAASGGDLDRRLVAFMQERSWLVHQSRHQRDVDALSAEATRALTDRLEALGTEALYLARAVMALLEERLTAAGASRNEVEARTEAVIQGWLAA